MSVNAVTELDFVKTKVEFARKFRAVVPEITDDQTLDLVDARHPLLEENLRVSSPHVSKGSSGPWGALTYVQTPAERQSF